MRQGELLGLKWADLDWEKGTLMTNVQLQRVEHEDWHLCLPKSQGRTQNHKTGHRDAGKTGFPQKGSKKKLR